MWGKLTQRNNRTKVKLIKDPHELYRVLATPGIDVANLVFASDEMVWASWSFVEEGVPNLCHTNEVVAFYVTAGARLHLYSYLEKLQQRAIYCDTDSVLFVQPNDEAALVETGGNLAAITSELKPFEYIEEFVSGGPKIYAYKIVNFATNQRKTVCKVRGITLN
jgi:hypothetical protein